ncbi:MAG: SDR family oxidoreductase [Anaerolineales bacterium]|nr:SDR family oxidoreductase [Anaerolineales bacterium]
MKTQGNTIFITGGSAGIGLSIAKAFLHLQNTVIVCGRDEQKLAQAQKTYPDLHTLRCDVTSNDDCNYAFQKITSEHEGLNILVNNAGIQFNYNLYEANAAPERIQQEIDTNFSSLAKLTSLFLPALMKQPEAAVVNVSSATGIVPKRNAAVYSATKAAVHSFSSVLRRQLANSTVRVFELFPPVVDTAMTRDRAGNKLSPDFVAGQLIRGMQQDTYEIPVGRARLLFLINRISPALAAQMIQRQS